MRFSRNQLDKAGQTVVSDDDVFKEAEAVTLIGDWRALHQPVLDDMTAHVGQVLSANGIPVALLRRRGGGIVKRLLLLLLLCVPLWAEANDGVYYANGNHLIPITETDISIRKEVLTIKHVENLLYVDVYYEFFNPAKDKTLLVGFEAADPYPCFKPEDYEKGYPNHPYIYNFTVEMNGKSLGYEVAHVDVFRPWAWKERTGTPEYYRHGQFQTIDFRQRVQELRDSEFYMNAGICYAYHFQAHFRPGVNTIHHTYQYKVSTTAGYEYSFTYVLTAANRWANRQIDDFTLVLDMGDRQSFIVEPGFYSSLDEWQIEGLGRKNDHRGCAMFHINQGEAVYQKKHFHPDGELELFGCDPLGFYINTKEDYLRAVEAMYLTAEGLSFMSRTDFTEAFTFSREERRILRNLPFAHRGYCFKNAALQAFYNATDWYLPDSTYTPDLEVLGTEERKWIEFWSEK